MNRLELSRVAVIGGGPAGSFFAIHLLELAGPKGLSLLVHIYEPRDFGQAGPRGCNRCAGILSSALIRNLAKLGLEVPASVIQAHISAYSLHSPFGEVEVEAPFPGEEIYSVYRGSGPLRSPLSPDVSFDSFLLSEALKRGACRIPLRVKGVRLKPHPAVDAGQGWEEYDLVVLATGVNASPLSVEGLAYRPPASQRMAQDELWAKLEDVQEAFGNKVRVFIFPHSDLVFGTLVPKGPFINVSLLARKGMPSIDEFLSQPEVKKALPFAYKRACGCQPLISLGLAHSPVGEGFAVVGDAAVTRLYKDGIGAALLTARQAAHVVVNYGCSAQALRQHYWPFLRALSRDNAYGRLLFNFHRRLSDSPAFFRAQAHLVTMEREHPGPRPYHRVLWGMFTGSYSYGEILRIALKPTFPVGLLSQALRERFRGEVLPSRKIVVLGAGFGGIYTIFHLERALRKQKVVELTLVNRENFFLFTPFLHEVATGGIETRHIAYPIRAMRGKRRFHFIQGEVQGVDLEKGAVVTDCGAVAYDYLVLALGSTADTRHLAATTPHLFTLKDLYDGIALRNHIISMFERADARPQEQDRLLTFVVVGGGATGVQLITEMRDFIFRSLLKNYPRVEPNRVRLVLVQDGERLLEDMDKKIATYALSVLKKKGVAVRLRAEVTAVPDYALEIDGREVIPTHTLVWTTGIRSNPIVENLPVEKDELGRAKVNQFYEVAGAPRVYALGDNARFVDPKTGVPLPARAHVAVRQGRALAHGILADLRGRPKRPYPVPWLAEAISLGSHEAAIKVWRLALLGRLARLLWLISYLSLVPGAYVRTRVLLDWLLAFVFGRDTTLLRLR